MELIPEEVILNQSWKVAFLEKIQMLSKNYVLKWLQVVSEIDNDEDGSKEYTDIFFEAVQRSYEDLILDMNNLYEKYIEIVGKYTEKLERLELKLQIEPYPHVYETSENVTLKTLIKHLESRIAELEAKQVDREKELNDLNSKYAFLSKKLGAIDETPPTSFSPTTLENLKGKIQTMAEVYNDRKEKFLSKRLAIKNIIDEHGIDLENSSLRNEILEISNDSIPVTDEVMSRMDIIYDNVIKLRDEMASKFDSLRQTLENLWNSFDYSISERLSFLSLIKTMSRENLEKMSNEVERLEKLKTENLENLIIIQKNKLCELWDNCHCSADDRNDFPIIYTQEYTENNLKIFENEVEKWQKYFDENKEILKTLNTYVTLNNNLHELKMNVDINKLYENRGGAFSTEIRKINILESRIKRNEQTLMKLSKQYSKRNGRPFKTFGQTIEESIKKQNFNKKVASRKPSTPKTQTNNLKTPNSEKAKVTQRSRSTRSASKTPLRQQKKSNKVTPTLPKFKLNETKISPTKKSNWKPSRVSLRSVKKDTDEDSWTSEYSEFEKEVTNKNIPRSSGITQE